MISGGWRWAPPPRHVEWVSDAACDRVKMLLKDKIVQIVQIDKNDKKDKIVQIFQIDQTVQIDQIGLIVQIVNTLVCSLH